MRRDARAVDAASLDIDERDGAVTLRVKVQPRASRDELAGARDGVLVVRLTAPPVDGAANEALTRLLGRVLGTAPSAVRIVAGARGRQKRVAVEGLDAATARTRLGSTGGR